MTVLKVKIIFCLRVKNLKVDDFIFIKTDGKNNFERSTLRYLLYRGTEKLCRYPFKGTNKLSPIILPAKNIEDFYHF
jgi:hypothetical protein